MIGIVCTVLLGLEHIADRRRRATTSAILSDHHVADRVQALADRLTALNTELDRLHVKMSDYGDLLQHFIQRAEVKIAEAAKDVEHHRHELADLRQMVHDHADRLK